MEQKITVRQWLQNYNAGQYGASANEQIKAGWYDWFCKTKALAGRLTKMANFIKSIKNEEVLDHYYVWFKNNCPCMGRLYDDARFEPMDETERNAKYFVVSFNRDTRDGVVPYSLYTIKHGENVPYESKKDVVAVVNNLSMLQ